MKKTLPLILFLIVFIISACAPQMSAPLTPLPAVTQVPVTEAPTAKLYANSEFGLGFQIPASWFGPEEYVSEGTLRVEVGSDKVYPYGEPPEQPSDVKNSYNIVIQYTKNNQNQYWKATLESLLGLRDGESFSDARSMVIRVRQFDLGRFKGFEYITTLSETAQTDPFYSRSVILFDGQSNDLVTILGQPVNVQVNEGANWRQVYQVIDDANLTVFHEILGSLTLE
ncbi:MAG: hypothetical protein K8S20_05910 [Chloroflexi bacterium]|nr:hypothetical protein [Chloroflexota bacterium]